MASPLLLVPSDPLALRVPDEHFVRETDAARQAGLDVAVVDHDAILARARVGVDEAVGLCAHPLT